MRAAAALFLTACWTSSPPPPEPIASSAPPPPMSKMSAPKETFDQSTPRAALTSFIRAVELERFDIVLRFVPAVYRDKMTEDKVRAQFDNSATREIVERLREHMDAEPVVSANTATLAYGTHFQVKLVLEEGVWRIQDLD